MDGAIPLESASSAVWRPSKRPLSEESPISRPMRARDSHPRLITRVGQQRAGPTFCAARETMWGLNAKTWLRGPAETAAERMTLHRETPSLKRSHHRTTSEPFSGGLTFPLQIFFAGG